jgi:carbon storage regulator
MLVLSRKPGQEVVIGSNIIVEVLTADSGRVRLGITAPADVKVFRRELIERYPQLRTDTDETAPNS